MRAVNGAFQDAFVVAEIGVVLESGEIVGLEEVVVREVGDDGGSASFYFN